MTRTFAPFRRIAAFSVAIALFAAPIASAQAPEVAPPNSAPANTALLSPAAFARLVQPAPADAVRAPVVADSPRPSLLRQGTAAVTREAQTAPTQAAPTKAPQQKSWLSRHKKGLILWSAIGVGAIFGGWGLLYLIYGED